MRVQLSFIGTGKYQPCIYVWNDQRCETPYFQEAAFQFFEPEDCLVLMTEEAERIHGQALSARIAYQPIRIPDGRTEDELWEIFSTLTEHVPQDATLIVDVTHGFRTQPMLALAALYYLRVTRNVEIERIVYGAFEAHNPETNEAPVFDLTPFLTLIDWSVAAHQFMRYGQAEDLARLIREIHRRTHVERAGVQARHAAPAASWLQGFARGLALARVTEVMTKHACCLPEALEQVRQEVNRIARLRPFELLLDQTAERVRLLYHDNRARKPTASAVGGIAPCP
ncbi:TIGR02221 family CRISPR-associated protein [Rhodothermus marinus]|uniref:TIGR02221 family CRISPR-associated protein n=1 Tax=Rhodothermus marinus TaxID=29549 RepID=UPI0012BA44A8|nr:TIGR02221 family CRISPR-associated protein [Rhodothermus marinus]BBM69618.1 hypothetical protein RmaAA213_14640 [Rhodothermus marinus]BBM72600.1 hypothetical protein RmaAA338_14650 [Rhodothermus marinus]